MREQSARGQMHIVIRVQTKKEGLTIIEAEVCVFRPYGNDPLPAFGVRRTAIRPHFDFS